jgi:hypothetical protein
LAAFLVAARLLTIHISAGWENLEKKLSLDKKTSVGNLRCRFEFGLLALEVMLRRMAGPTKRREESRRGTQRARAT